MTTTTALGAYSRSSLPLSPPPPGHRFLPRWCFPSSSCFGRCESAVGAKSLCLLDFLTNIACILYFLILRQNIRSPNPPSVQVSLSWNVAFLVIDWVILYAIGQKKVVTISVCQFLIVARVVCCVAIILAVSAFALPDLESFISRWRSGNSAREGVLACVFGLYAYSIWFFALHVYLIMLLNGAKSTMESEAENDDKTVSTLQAGSHARIVQVMRHSLARRLNRRNRRRRGSVGTSSSLMTTSSSLSSSLRRHSLSSPSSSSTLTQTGFLQFGITPTPKLRPVTPLPAADGGDPLADPTPVIMRPLRPGYHATHLDPWQQQAVTSKKAAGRTAPAAAAVDVERQQQEDELRRTVEGQN